jgi:hypothetical protein
MGGASLADRFELALLADRRGDRAIALAELLDRSAKGTDWPDVRLRDTTLLFVTGGTDWMPLHWVLGDLAPLGRQLTAAATRLRADEVAIVRCAVDDRADVSYFLFEPDEAAVSVSLFRPPADLRYVYPTSPAHGARLYDYVTRHRSSLLTRPVDHDDPGDILGATAPRDWLVAALEREAGRAKDVEAEAAQRGIE